MRRAFHLLLLLIASQSLPLNCGLQQHSRRLWESTPPRRSHHVSEMKRVFLQTIARFLQDAKAPCKAPSFQVQYGGLAFCTRCTEDQEPSTSEDGVAFCKAVSCADKYGLSRPLWNPTLGICQAAPGSLSCLPGFICAGTPALHQPSSGVVRDITSDNNPTEGGPSPDLPRISSVPSPPPPTEEQPYPMPATSTGSPVTTNTGGQGSDSGQLQGTPDLPTVVHPLGTSPAYSSATSPPPGAGASPPCGPHGSWSTTTGQCVCARGWAPSTPGSTSGSNANSGSTSSANGDTWSMAECSNPQGALANPPVDSDASTATPGAMANTPGGHGAAAGGGAGSGSSGGTSGVPVVWVVLVALALLALSCACGAAALCCWRTARRERRGLAQDKEQRKSPGDVRSDTWHPVHGSLSVIREGAQGTPVPISGAPGVHPALIGGGHATEAHHWDASSALHPTGTPCWYQMSAVPLQLPPAGPGMSQGVQRGRGLSEPPPVPAHAVLWMHQPAESSQGPQVSPTWAKGVPETPWRGDSHSLRTRPASSSDPPPCRGTPAASPLPGAGNAGFNNLQLPVGAHPARRLRCLEETPDGEGAESLC